MQIIDFVYNLGSLHLLSQIPFPPSPRTRSYSSPSSPLSSSSSASGMTSEQLIDHYLILMSISVAVEKYKTTSQTVETPHLRYMNFTSVI